MSWLKTCNAVPREASVRHSSQPTERYSGKNPKRIGRAAGSVQLQDEGELGGGYFRMSRTEQDPPSYLVA